jgi:hypothetical protein
VSTDELIAKLRSFGTLPEWAAGPISPAEARLLVAVVTDLRKNEEVRARIIRELRAAQQWVVARDGGRYCERCEQEVSRGEAYENLPGTGGLIAHVRCPEVPS